MRSKASLAIDRLIFNRTGKYFPRRARIKFAYVTIIQTILGGLDLVGVALVGVLSALAISGVESKKSGNRVNEVLNFLHIDGLSFTAQAAVIGLLAGFFLVARTLISVLIVRKVYFFLARESARITKELISFLLSSELLYVQRKTTQEHLYAVTTGVSALTLGIVGSAVNMISDASIMLIVALGLFFLDPATAIGAALLFGFIGIVLHRLTNRRAHELGLRDSYLQMTSNQQITEVLNSYRESIVKNRRKYYAESIGRIRMDLANTSAEFAFMPNISKYVIESAVILGGLTIGAVEFYLKDAVHAIATLTIFLAAGTRIAPAVLRIQQGSLQIRGSMGVASPTLKLLEEYSQSQLEVESYLKFTGNYAGFIPDIKLTQLYFRYPGSAEYAIDNVSLEIRPGSSLAVVGPSGSGKSTLIDCMLGLLKPEKGTAYLGGVDPLKSFEEWPGSVGYVPQDVMIVSGSIRDNVVLGFPETRDSEAGIWAALEVAHLSKFVKGLPKGLDTQVGDRGASLSGGQRQRLGIARALYTNPRLLVMDEATSALDAETEEAISNTLQNLKGSVTIIMIAHRLSTVRRADKVIYLDSGKIITEGTFEEVQKKVPAFANQAKLMGL